MSKREGGEMFLYAVDICRKYTQIKIIEKEAEASWRANLEEAAGAKYPSEKEMYDIQAEEAFSKYAAAREWLRLVDTAVSKVHGEKVRAVLKQNCIAGTAMKAIVVHDKPVKYLSRSTATRYKKTGLEELSVLLAPVRSRLEKAEKIIFKIEPCWN